MNSEANKQNLLCPRCFGESKTHLDGRFWNKYTHLDTDGFKFEATKRVINCRLLVSGCFGYELPVKTLLTSHQNILTPKSPFRFGCWRKKKSFALVLLPLLPLANLDAPYVLEGVRRSDYSTLRETHIGCFILTLNGTTTTAAPISPVIATPPPPPLRAPRFCPASASWFYVPPSPSVSVLFLSFHWAKSL